MLLLSNLYVFETLYVLPHEHFRENFEKQTIPLFKVIYLNRLNYNKNDMSAGVRLSGKSIFSVYFIRTNTQKPDEKHIYIHDTRLFVVQYHTHACINDNPTISFLGFLAGFIHFLSI